MYKLLLIWRYFWYKPITWLAVLAVTLVVMTVVVVLSVMAGLVEDTRWRNHRWSGDVIIKRDSLVGFPYYEGFLERVRALDEVAAATAVVRTVGLLGEGGEAVELIGMDLAAFCQVTGFQETLHRLCDVGEPTFVAPPGRFTNAGSIELTAEQQQRGCIVGQFLLGMNITDAERMYCLRYAPPWPVTVFGLNSRGVLAGSEFGQHQQFWYVDASDSRLPRVDDMTIYVDIDELQTLALMDGADGQATRVSEIRVRLAEGVALEEGRRRVHEAWRDHVAQMSEQPQGNLLSDVDVLTWEEFRRAQIAPAEKEKNVLVLVFSMIGVVVVFVIFAIFYMILADKVKDLGILKSVGAARGGVGQVFLGFGAFIGLLGGLIGAALGALIVNYSNEIEAAIRSFLHWMNGRFESHGIAYRFGEFHIWTPGLYAIDRIPDTVDWMQVGAIVLTAVAASVAGAALPALLAARLQVVDALRVD